jgi:hypothetical protein
MHTVWVADETKNGFGNAALGIIFSVDKFTANLNEAQNKIIDQFFEKLSFNDQG